MMDGSHVVVDFGDWEAFNQLSDFSSFASLLQWETRMGRSVRSTAFAQLCVGVGSKLDSHMARSLNASSEKDCAIIDDVVVITSGTANWGTKSQCDRGILAYVCDSSRMWEGHQHYSMAIDKSRVCGYAVANGMVVLPTSQAFYTVSQVSLVGPSVCR